MLAYSKLGLKKGENHLLCIINPKTLQTKSPNSNDTFKLVSEDTV